MNKIKINHIEQTLYCHILGKISGNYAINPASHTHTHTHIYIYIYIYIYI